MKSMTAREIINLIDWLLETHQKESGPPPLSRQKIAAFNPLTARRIYNAIISCSVLGPAIPSTPPQIPGETFSLAF